MIDTEKTLKIGSISQYIKILEYNENEFAEVFRGQSNKEWELVPSIQRFAESCKYVEGEASNWKNLEELLIENFMVEAAPYMRNEPSGRLEKLVHAQHYGLPTALLDWTTNPLKGLYFAVEDSNYDSIDGAVFFGHAAFDYISRLENDDTEGSGFISCFQSRHLNERILAQEGCFSLHALPFDFDKFSTLTWHDESNNSNLSLFSKIIIPADCKIKIRRELTKLGITKKTLFPGLDSITDSIKQKIIDGDKNYY